MQIVNQIKYENYNIIEYDVVDSTMNIIKSFSENTVIIAQQQTSGVGKTGRKWDSENSGNLYFSIIKKAGKTNLDYSQLSFLASVAMRQSIQGFQESGSKPIVSKWPNDVLVDNKKVCGILLQFDYLTKDVVIGIGVNINSYPENAAFAASSLKSEGINVEKYELLKKFLSNLNFLFDEWENQGFAPIREKWLKSCYKLNDKIIANGVEGIFKDIDKDGTLIMELNNHELFYIKSGDVF